MKNIVDVLNQKEQELQIIQLEVEALRVAMRLVSDEGDSPELSLTSTQMSSDSQRREAKTGSSSPRFFPTIFR